MRPMPWAPPVTRAVLPRMLKRSVCSCMVVSDPDDHLAETMLVLQVQQPLAGLGQHEGTLDHRLDALLTDEGEHVTKILRIPDLAAHDAGAAQENIGCIAPDLVTRRRA